MWVILHEQFTPKSIIGCILIAVGTMPMDMKKEML
jgi:uncharacterized membrane protein